MNNEIIKTLEKYIWNNECELHYLGSDKKVNEISKFLTHNEVLIDDRPDMAICIDDKCLAIEHFEFDCYEKKKNGSQNKKEQARIKRNITKTDEIIRDQIYGKCSYENYIKNVTNTFLVHYNKIEDYRSNLLEKDIINKNTYFKMAFLIEDVSPIGSIVYNCDGLKPIFLSHCREFLDLLQLCISVDYIIACSTVNYHRYIWIIGSEDIKEYKDNAIEYGKMSFFDPTPQVSGWVFKLPND